MSDKIVPFRPKGGSRNGGGPDDPSLPTRVARLEEQQSRIEAMLREIRDGQQRTNDGQQRVALEVAEMKGRFAGLDGRIGAMPTTLQLLGLFLAVLVASGILQWFGPRLAQIAGPPAAVTGAPR